MTPEQQFQQAQGILQDQGSDILPYLPESPYSTPSEMMAADGITSSIGWTTAAGTLAFAGTQYAFPRATGDPMTWGGAGARIGRRALAPIRGVSYASHKAAMQAAGRGVSYGRAIPSWFGAMGVRGSAGVIGGATAGAALGLGASFAGVALMESAARNMVTGSRDYVATRELGRELGQLNHFEIFGQNSILGNPGGQRPLGMTSVQTQALGNTIGGLASNLGISGAQMRNMASTMGTSGMLDTSNVESLRRSLHDGVKELKRMSEMIGADLQQTLGVYQSLESMGFRDKVSRVKALREQTSVSRLTGMSLNEVGNVGLRGVELARSAGLNESFGYNTAMNTLTTTAGRYAQGDINQRYLDAVGGIGGYTERMTALQMGLSQTGFGQSWMSRTFTPDGSSIGFDMKGLNAMRRGRMDRRFAKEYDPYALESMVETMGEMLPSMALTTLGAVRSRGRTAAQRNRLQYDYMAEHMNIIDPMEQQEFMRTLRNQGYGNMLMARQSLDIQQNLNDPIERETNWRRVLSRAGEEIGDTIASATSRPWQRFWRGTGSAWTRYHTQARGEVDAVYGALRRDAADGSVGDLRFEESATRDRDGENFYRGRDLSSIPDLYNAVDAETGGALTRGIDLSYENVGRRGFSGGPIRRWDRSRRVAVARMEDYMSSGGSTSRRRDRLFQDSSGMSEEERAALTQDRVAESRRRALERQGYYEGSAGKLYEGGSTAILENEAYLDPAINRALEVADSIVGFVGMDDTISDEDLAVILREGGRRIADPDYRPSRMRAQHSMAGVSGTHEIRTLDGVVGNLGGIHNRLGRELGYLTAPASHKAEQDAWTRASERGASATFGAGDRETAALVQLLETMDPDSPEAAAIRSRLPAAGRSREEAVLGAQASVNAEAVRGLLESSVIEATGKGWAELASAGALGDFDPGADNAIAQLGYSRGMVLASGLGGSGDAELRSHAQKLLEEGEYDTLASMTHFAMAGGHAKSAYDFLGVTRETADSTQFSQLNTAMQRFSSDAGALRGQTLSRSSRSASQLITQDGEVSGHVGALIQNQADATFSAAKLRHQTRQLGAARTMTLGNMREAQSSLVHAAITAMPSGSDREAALKVLEDLEGGRPVSALTDQERAVLDQAMSGARTLAASGGITSMTKEQVDAFLQTTTLWGEGTAGEVLNAEAAAVFDENGKPVQDAVRRVAGTGAEEMVGALSQVFDPSNNRKGASAQAALEQMLPHLSKDSREELIATVSGFDGKEGFDASDFDTLAAKINAGEDIGGVSFKEYQTEAIRNAISNPANPAERERAQQAAANADNLKSIRQQLDAVVAGSSAFAVNVVKLKNTEGDPVTSSSGD